MRIIIVRHAEPNYAIDYITKNGQKEALALKDRLIKEKIDYVYISPLKRAFATAKPYLDISNKDYKICDWLEEFAYFIKDENNKDRIAWDLDVLNITSKDELYDNSRWMKSSLFDNSTFEKGYEYVTQQFDELLALHGYKRKGKYYEVIKGNKDTLIFFCHLGLQCVLLSHLMSIPSVVIAQHFSPSPSSVTILYTEEKHERIAQFRAQCLGDTSHLYAANITPSFMGRFKENYEDK